MAANAGSVDDGVFRSGVEVGPVDGAGVEGRVGALQLWRLRARAGREDRGRVALAVLSVASCVIHTHSIFGNDSILDCAAHTGKD